MLKNNTRRAFLGTLVCGLFAGLVPASEKKLSNVWRKLPDGWELTRMKHLNIGDIIKIDTVPGEFRVADRPVKHDGVWGVSVEPDDEKESKTETA